VSNRSAVDAFALQTLQQRILFAGNQIDLDSGLGREALEQGLDKVLLARRVEVNFGGVGGEGRECAQGDECEELRRKGESGQHETLLASGVDIGPQNINENGSCLQTSLEVREATRVTVENARKTEPHTGRALLKWCESVSLRTKGLKQYPPNVY